jgi:hypothetical protein
MITYKIMKFLSSRHKYYIIFKLLILLFICTFLPNTGRHISAEQGYETYRVPFGVTNKTTFEYKSPDKDKGPYPHRTNKETYDLFTAGVTGVTDPSLNVPVPVVLRTVLERACPASDPLCSPLIDDYYPDGVFASIPTPDSDTISTSYAKKCKDDEASILLLLTLKDLAGLNIGLPSNQNLLDTTYKKDLLGNITSVDFQYKSSLLKSKSLSSHVLFEFCYVSEIKQFNKPTEPIKNGTTTYGRKILGSASLASIGKVFPPQLGTSQQFVVNKDYLQKQGTPISTSGYTTDKPVTPNLNGYRYGEFQISQFSSQLYCDLKNKIFGTDIFGNKINGVNTALGCLPGSFEGIFAVILRISMGLSGAILLVMLFVNAAAIANSQNNPEKIKKCIGNITRIFIGLAIIIFGTFILNFFGVKILLLGEFGSIGIEQILGK